MLLAGTFLSALLWLSWPILPLLGVFALSWSEGGGFFQQCFLQRGLQLMGVIGFIGTSKILQHLN